MQNFNFSRLINKYKTNFAVLIPSEGHYDEKGDYVQVDVSRKDVEGAIISIKDSKIFRSDGTLTEKDKNLFMLEPISNDLKGATAVYKGNHYRIESCQEDFEFTGVYAYVLKFISAFNEEDSDD